MNKAQSGNVLFYILIAVAMLAALSFAISQSSRGGITKIGEEKAGIYASEIIEYGSILSQAVSQIRLRGYNISEISFENNVVAGYVNGACVDVGCEIFNIDGGAINYTAPKPDWLDSASSASLRYGELYFHGNTSAIEVGLAADDLIMFIPYLKKPLCVAINNKLGIVPASLEVPVESHGPFADNVKFTGIYGSGFDRKVSGDATTGETDILYNQMSGCVEASGTAATPATGTYHYYQVLIAR